MTITNIEIFLVQIFIGINIKYRINLLKYPYTHYLVAVFFTNLTLACKN